MDSHKRSLAILRVALLIYYDGKAPVGALMNKEDFRIIKGYSDLSSM